MKSDARFFVGVVLAAVLILGGIVIFSKHSSSSSGPANIDTQTGEKLGSDSAKVKIVEFSDFQCPACKAAAQPLRDAVAKNSTDVQLIYRYFPLPIHKNGKISARAGAAAAKQGKFWQMFDLLFQTQDEWSSQTDPANTFVILAKQLNLNADQYKTDLNSDELKKKVDDDSSYALSLSTDQTPTFYINGKKVVGVQTLENWQQLIDDAKK